MKAKYFLAMVLLGIGCDKAAPAPEAPPEPEPKIATQTIAKPEAAPEDPAAAADFSKFTDEQWCPRAHQDTAKIVEAMKATIKRSGSEIKDESMYEPPDAERYVGLCNKLPVQMRKCLVIGYAAQNREECQTALDGLDAEAKATYTELMGK